MGRKKEVSLVCKLSLCEVCVIRMVSWVYVYVEIVVDL